MRTGTGTVQYLIGDHLGSTSLTLNNTGGLVAEIRYTAWGESRYTSGTTPTARRYTGQIEESGLGGLYFYNARWYEPTVGRFVQADTVVPGAGNPQALNRYSYVLNAPLTRNDPSGHEPCETGSSLVCDEAGSRERSRSTRPTLSPRIPLIDLLLYASEPDDRRFSIYTLSGPSGGVNRYSTAGNASVVVDWHAGEVGLFLSEVDPNGTSATFPAQGSLFSVGRGVAYGSANASLDDFSGAGATVGLTFGPRIIAPTGEVFASPTNALRGTTASLALGWSGVFPTVDKLWSLHPSVGGKALPNGIVGFNVAGYTYNSYSTEVARIYVGQTALTVAAFTAASLSPAWMPEFLMAADAAFSP